MSTNMSPLVPFSILIIVVLLGFLFTTSNKRANSNNFGNYANANFENFQSPNSPIAPTSQLPDSSIAAITPTKVATAQSGLGNINPSNDVGDEMYNPVVASPMEPVSSCYPRDRLTATDLLPKDAANSRWAQMNPSGQGDISDQNFLTAGYHVGINTVGSTMKNANLQLRSEPPNPRLAVSPWNVSTIEYSDINRRPLEIGGDY
jgi:hypothetical protein